MNFVSVRRAALPPTVVISLLLAACATEGKPPVADLAVARTSLRQAETADALQYAPVELLSARDKLSRAEVAMRDSHFNEARRLSDEAAADADVAERKARAVKSARTAEELEGSNAVLGSELGRTPLR